MNKADDDLLKKMKADAAAKPARRVIRTPEERAAYEAYLKSLSNRMQSAHGDPPEPPPAKS